MSNSIATGVAYADPVFKSCYATEEFGYSSVAQGNVVQATSKSTAVTLNKPAGTITMNASALGAGASALFTVNNNTITDNDVVIVNVVSGGTAGAYWPYVASSTNGSFVLGLWNATAGSLSEAVVLKYAIIHCHVDK